jgi:hypothetical protein
VDPLEELEHWFLSEIVGPHEGRTRKTTERAHSAIRHVKPSATLAAEERVEIYSGMYFTRLHDVLADDFRATRSLCGAGAFEKLVRAYLREQPSRHYSLNPLGRGLPAFLAGPYRVPKKALLADVARLENAISAVFDAHEVSALTSEDVARVAPESWPNARMHFVDALELHAFDHRANAIVRALRQDEPLPSLAKSRTFTVVWRKDWTVWRLDVSEPMFAILAALHDGLRFSEAIERGSRLFRGSPEELQAEIARSFSTWIAEGFFARIDAS